VLEYWRNRNSKPVSVTWYLPCGISPKGEPAEGRIPQGKNVRFVCNLVLGVLDFTYLKQTLGSRYGPKWVQILVTICLLLTLSLPAAASGTHPAAKVVEKLHAELLDVMKQAHALGYKGRYQQLVPVVTSSYDFPSISKVVVGRYWSEFTPKQKEQFVNLFTKLSIATYANQFAGYAGEHFKTISAEESTRGRFLIKTVLIKSNGEEVALDYILHHKERQWQIINVIAQGVSDLSLKRAQYTSYLRKNGFDGLLQKINDKIKSYEG
jgi:phospholipid transport system substrate-binding protein